jgi:hypothetical protein
MTQPTTRVQDAMIDNVEMLCNDSVMGKSHCGDVNSAWMEEDLTMP